jgi:hypothetical protein
MRKKLTIVFTLIATPFVLAKLIDVHLPSSEEIYIEHMKERNRENNQAWDKINDKDSSEAEKAEAYDTLMNNGEMA